MQITKQVEYKDIHKIFIYIRKLNSSSQISYIIKTRNY